MLPTDAISYKCFYYCTSLSSVKFGTDVYVTKDSFKKANKKLYKALKKYLTIYKYKGK